jgi:hypothetical protein
MRTSRIGPVWFGSRCSTDERRRYRSCVLQRPGSQRGHWADMYRRQGGKEHATSNIVGRVQRSERTSKMSLSMDLGTPTTVHTTFLASHSSWIAFAAALPPFPPTASRHISSHASVSITNGDCVLTILFCRTETRSFASVPFVATVWRMAWRSGAPSYRLH